MSFSERLFYEQSNQLEDAENQRLWREWKGEEDCIEEEHVYDEYDKYDSERE